MQAIVGFSNYLIDRDGNIYNKFTGNMKAYQIKNGYKRVGLRQNYKDYNRTIHTLVARTFIPNPDNLPVVNHKNGIKTNNCVENLEWTTHKGNSEHAVLMGLNKTRAVPIVQYSLSNEFVEEYESITEASNKTGFNLASISQALTLENGKSHGFIWRYKDSVGKRVKPRTTRKKTIEQLDRDGNIINTFESARGAAKTVGISEGYMSTLCKKGSQYNGFIYRWKELIPIMTEFDKLEQESINWKSLPHISKYRISPDGRVWSKKYGLLKTCSNDGYETIGLYLDDGSSKIIYKVHRLVFEIYIGPIPENFIINHKNGIKIDNRVENLEIATYSENSQHAVDIGLRVYDPVIQLNCFGEEIAHYKNATEAQKVTGINAKAISAAISRVSLNNNEFFWIKEGDPLPLELEELQKNGVKNWKKHPIHNYYISPLGEVWSIRNMILLEGSAKKYNGSSYVTYSIYDQRADRNILKKINVLIAETYIRLLEDDEDVICIDSDTMNSNKDNIQIVKKSSISVKTGKIIQLDRNHNHIQTFENITAVLDSVIIKRPALSTALCRGDIGGGFYWKYEYTTPNQK